MTAFVRRLSLLSIGALLSVLAGAAAGAAAPQAYLVDGDGDGVSDEIDDCPYTHPGAVVDAHGCALDGDFDGVADGLDRCPNTALSLPVDSKGCAKGDRIELAQAVPKPAASANGKSRKPPATATASAPAAVIVAETPVAAPAVSAPQPVIARAPAVLPKLSSATAVITTTIAAELPKADFKFADNSDHLSRGQSSLLQSYAKVFARRLAMNAKSSLHLRAYADHRETNVAGLVAARAAVVRTALIAQGIAADRIVADSGVLRDGKAGDNRRVEVKFGE